MEERAGLQLKDPKQGTQMNRPRRIERAGKLVFGSIEDWKMLIMVYPSVATLS
jgi:hypothetical protein